MTKELIINIISIIAAILTTSSFLPQAIKIIETKDGKSISLIMYILFSTGVLFWIIFGLLIENIAIITANIITLILSLTILFIKITNK